MQPLGHYEEKILAALEDNTDPGHRTRVVREFARAWRNKQYERVLTDLKQAAEDEAEQRDIEARDRLGIDRAAAMLRVTTEDLEKLIRWELFHVYENPRDVSATVTTALIDSDSNKLDEWWRKLLTVTPDDAGPKHQFLAGS
jgi:hypothetical protein